MYGDGDAFAMRLKNVATHSKVIFYTVLAQAGVFFGGAKNWMSTSRQYKLNFHSKTDKHEWTRAWMQRSFPCEYECKTVASHV